MHIHGEYEIVSHNKINHLKLFLVDLYYRNSHIHHDFEFCLVLRGEVSVYSNRENYQFKQDDLILFNPLQPHALRATNEHALILSMQVSPKFCSSFFPNITRLHFEHTDLSAALERKQNKKLKEILLELANSYFDKSYGYEFMCISLVNDLFYHLLQSVPHRVISEAEQTKELNRFNRIRRILRYIEENYSNKLLLSEIAKQENLSLTYLSHLFKDSLNITFQEYLNQIRFEKAKRLIEQTDMKLIDICIETGFSDPRYLNKMFKKMLGCTASQYRQMRKAESEVPLSSKLQTQSIQSFYTDEESLAIIKSYKIL